MSSSSDLKIDPPCNCVDPDTQIMDKRLQCKDIPDFPILRFLNGLYDGFAVLYDADPRPIQSVLNAMPAGVPQKLALAKMRTLLRRGLVDGCGCGCRGDFNITEKGRRMLAEPHSEDQIENHSDIKSRQVRVQIRVLDQS